MPVARLQHSQLSYMKQQLQCSTLPWSTATDPHDKETFSSRTVFVCRSELSSMLDREQLFCIKKERQPVTTWNAMSAEVQENMCETQWQCANRTTLLWDLLVFICKAELPSLSPSSGGFAKDSWTDQCTATLGKAQNHIQSACLNANRIMLHGFALNVVWPELCWLGRVWVRRRTTSMSLPLAVWFSISLSFSWRDWGHKFWVVLHLVA